MYFYFFILFLGLRCHDNDEATTEHTINCRDMNVNNNNDVYLINGKYWQNLAKYGQKG